MRTEYAWRHSPAIYGSSFPCGHNYWSCLLLRCKIYLKVNAKLPPCFQNYRVGGQLVQVFAAVILLSYNRLCEITTYLLTPSLAYNETLQAVESIVYYQGDYLSQNSQYVSHYKIPAYFVTVLLIFVLLHYPMIWIEKIVSTISWVKKSFCQYCHITGYISRLFLR